MPEHIVQFHHDQLSLRIECHEYLVEAAVLAFAALAFGRSLQPFQAILVAVFHERKTALDFVVAGEQRGGTATQGRIQFPDCHLIQVGIVQPEFGTVSDDELLVGLLVSPAEFAGTLKLHDAGRALDALAVLIQNLLSEIRLCGMCRGNEGLEFFDGSGVGGCSEQGN